MTKNEPAFLTVSELADFLRVSQRTAYMLLRSGEVPSVKVGGSYRIPRRTLVAQLAKQMVGLRDGGDPV
jgi:excisionase family DNA binding protein